MNNTYCMGCMRQRPPEETACPVCGYKHGEAANPDFALPAGTRLFGGKYLIGKVLGRGGFGITYLGLDTTLGMKVAVKECFPTNMATRITDTHGLTWAPTVENVGSIQRIFTNEARKIARMEDVYGIVKVREVFEENNTEYIVMGFIEGETLRDRLRRNGPLDPETCLNLLRPVMTALSAAHHMGMIHRDISPDNIMVRSSDRSVWLLDLGAAKDMEGSIGGPDVAQSTHLIVRNGYSPLEQYNKKEGIGPWTDVYALCATAYFCMTVETPPSVMDRVGQEELAIPEEVPEPVAAVLRKGLSLSGRSRQQSMNELLMEFEAAVKTVSLSDATPSPISGHGSKPRSSPGRWIAAALVLALLIGAGAGFWWWKQSGLSGPVENGEDESTSGPSDTQDGGGDEITLPPVETVVGQGNLSGGISWNLYNNGLLYIMGRGDMDNWEDPADLDDPVDTENLADTEGVEDTEQNPNPVRPGWEDMSNMIQTIVIQDGITSIGDFSFTNYEDLTSVKIPNSVMKIGRFSFYGCSSIEEIFLPENVIEIQDRAFMNCSGLKEIYVPEGVEAVQRSAFNGCTSLEMITLPNTVKSFEMFAFRGCASLAELTIPENVTEIGDYAFENCSGLQEISIPEGVENIHRSVFSGCSSLENVTIPNTVKSIEDSAFADCSALTEFTIPEDVTEIGNYAFQNCSGLKEMTIPEGVEIIHWCTFDGCTALEKITLPNTVKSIEFSAFSNCTSLSDVTIPDSVAEIGLKVFEGCTALKTVSVPAGVEIAYNAFPEGFEPTRRT